MSGPIQFPDLGVSIPETSTAYQIERALEPFTGEMNRTPLVVNHSTWERNFHRVGKEVDLLTQKCRVESGDVKFRPNASADCAAVFTIRGLKLRRKTSGGAYSMDMEVLEDLQSQGDPLIGMVIDARHRIATLSQLRKWEEYAVAGTVQATWLQYGSPASRYTCENPSLHNRVTEIRETIEAPVGYVLLSKDLGQAEYVSWASLSGDPVLAGAFKMKLDVHVEMANLIIQEVPSIDLHGTPLRQFGKTINFAILYRMQVGTLASKLGCTYEVAQSIFDAIKRRAPRGLEYIEEVLTAARATGRVSTYFGRVRELPILRSSKKGELKEVEKTAWHMHNSGTAAELLKIKTVRAMNRVREAGFGFDVVRIGLNMHDECVWLVKEEMISEIEPLLQKGFDQPIKGFLEFTTDTRVGKNWLEVSK